MAIDYSNVLPGITRLRDYGRKLSAEAKKEREEIDETIRKIKYAKSSLTGEFGDDKEGLGDVLLKGEQMAPRDQLDHYSNVLLEMKAEKTRASDELAVLQAEADMQKTEAQTRYYDAQAKSWNAQSQSTDMELLSNRNRTYNQLAAAWEADENQSTQKTQQGLRDARSALQALNDSSDQLNVVTAKDVIQGVLGIKVDDNLNRIPKDSSGDTPFSWIGKVGEKVREADERRKRAPNYTPLFPPDYKVERGQGRRVDLKSRQEQEKERRRAESLYASEPRTPEQIEQEAADRLQRSKRRR